MPEIGLAEARLAENLAEAGKPNVVLTEPLRERQIAFPSRLHVGHGVAEIFIAQDPAVLFGLGLLCLGPEVAR